MQRGPLDEVLRNLVVLAKEGDRKAYGKIFRLCYRDIYDYIVRRVGNRNDAEDLAMQVFTRGLIAVSSYEERGHSVRAWFFRIAHNAVVDHFRVKVQSADIENIPEMAGEVSVENGIIIAEELDSLYREIKALPKAQAEVLTLRFIEDMGVAETAMVLNKKEVTVRALQFKGIKNLRERLGVTGSKPDERKTGLR